MNRPTEYQILVGETLDEGWSEWFGMAVEAVVLPGGRAATRLSGELPDQPALFGVLLKVRDLNLVLIRVERMDN
jgi:hypothetical protein